LQLEQIAESFFDQPETQTLYPPGTHDRNFIQSVYDNLFNRAPDSAGWSYWEQELSSGRIPKSVFILAVINGALGPDETILENKKEVGIAYVDAGLNNTQWAKEVMSNVTADLQSVDEAISMINGFANAVNGEIKNLLLYNNPTDSRIVSFEKDGKQLLFSGIKDSSGAPERIDSLYLVDGDGEFTIYYNEFGLPSKSINHADESIAKFEYTSGQFPSSSNPGAFDRVLNGIKAEITTINGTASETTVKTETLPSVEVSTLGPSTEIVKGNVVINVDYCGEPALSGTNVRVNYTGGFVNKWTEAKVQPGVAGQFIATIPERYDPNLPDVPDPDPTHYTADMCHFSDKVVSSLCDAPNIMAAATTLCSAIGITIPVCLKAFGAYSIYCNTAIPGTPPGTILGEQACNALGSLIDGGTRKMSVTAYVCPKGARSCKTDYLAISTPQKITEYGKHNLSFYLQVLEPSFEGFTFSPLFPRMVEGYEATANFSCIQGKTLVLKVENELGTSSSIKSRTNMTASINKYVPGRSFADDQTFAQDFFTATVKNDDQAVELQKKLRMRWDKSVVDDTPSNHKFTKTSTRLYAVWAWSNDGAIAAGEYNSDGPIIGYPLYEYNGVSWTESTLMIPDYGTITDLWGTSENDIYAVTEGSVWNDSWGYYDGGKILHYNGTSWSAINGDPFHDGNSFRSIWGASIPYLGSHLTTIYATGITGISNPFVYRLDDSGLGGWIHYRMEDIVGVNDAIVDIHSNTAGNTYLISNNFNNYNSSSILKLSNSEWIDAVQEYSFPISYYYLNGIWVAPDNQVFVVLDSRGEGSHLVYYNPGNDSWKADIYSSQFTNIHNLDKIWGRNSSDVYAVGTQYTSPEKNKVGGMVLHYDGTSWTEVSLPEEVGILSLTGVSGVDNIFAVGSRYGGGGVIFQVNK
jgi:roadblock/LC7 domain-containing protein